MKRLLQDARHAFQLNARLLWHTPSLGSPATDYEAYWRERLKKGPGKLNAFQAFRARWIAGRVSAGSSVLDVGCGDGGILAYLRDVAAVRPVGADLSPHVLNFLRERGIEAVLLDLNAGGVAALPESDHLLLLEVLEHLQNPEQVLREALGKARRSVFFSVPNTGYFAYRLRLLFGGFPMQWKVHPGEHVRFWTLRDMRWWLGALGLLERSTIRGYQGIPLLNRLWPSMFAMGMIVEVRVPPESAE